MISATQAIRALITVAAVISWPPFPAHSQAFARQPGSGGYDAPPVRKQVPVDEKAYKAALERIPAPDRKYDPWGVARPAEPSSTVKKSNER